MMNKSHLKLIQRRAIFTFLLVLLPFLLTACSAMPTPTAIPTPVTFTNPVLDRDFPDPDVLKVGADYYAYATNANGANIQAAKSTDLVHWDVLANALPKLPTWAVQEFGSVWAPEVFNPAEGQFVMYFVARFAIGFDGMQCIGVATSDDPAGPFTSPNPKPFICQTDEGGSIDPSTFVDADGQRYVLWKNDGNCCGYQVWLYIQKVSADGLTLQGEPQRLLTVDQTWEGIVVEAPTLWHQEGKYHLFYSANAYNDRRYAVGHAIADDILGPYSKAEEPFLATNIGAGLVGPGGQDVVLGPHGDTWMVVHGWAPGGYRRMYLLPLHWEKGEPVLEFNGREPLPVP
jgi:arabinan endo-1,5-alpha-L-arabinosidase